MINNESDNKMCNICYKTIKLNDKVKLKYQHCFCKECMIDWLNCKDHNPVDYKYIELINHKQRIVKCPVCRREYYRTLYDNILLKDTISYDYKSIICKVHFKNNLIWTAIEPMQLFSFTCKSHICKDNRHISYNKDWHRRIRVIVSLLSPIYESKEYLNPLVLWIYKDTNNTIKLKSTLDKNGELMDAYDYYNEYCADVKLIDEFIDQAIILPLKDYGNIVKVSC